MSPRVLVVDDEWLVAENLEAYLEDEGMGVTSVGSAEEAVELVEKGLRWDVCIMDLRLPGMDGRAAIHILHRLRPEMRFIIHTGSATFAVPTEMRDMGIADIQLFKKPVVDMEALADTVRSLAP